MTVTYTAEVATCTGFGCFLKLLLRWRGSIYKLVWPDLFAFLILYYSLNFLYRYVLDPDQRKIFESISEYCETYSNLIPLSFVLGFYISLIMTRWWGQYTSIPWPDTCAVFVSSHIHGQDDRGRVMRRTIMRYVCLCLTVVLTNISPRVKKRFPSLEHFVDAGLLVENEKAIITDLNLKFPRHSKHWLPIVWAASIVTRARKEGRIRDDFAVKTIIDELNTFRGRCGLLLQYDSISVPLVYTQVVTLATYSFFITSVMGRQWLDVEEGNLKNHKNYIDLYFPLFTTLQFFFYMGWLKVAESLINPFGEDDDDFEVNWMVDRNLTVSYLIVDEMHHEHPELIRDQYWDEVFPTELPYTVGSEQYREQVPVPSTANIAVSEADAEYIAPSSLKIDGDLAGMGDDNASGIHFTARRSNSRLSVRRMSGERQRTYSGGSQTSINTNLGSVPNSLQRVGSVTSVLKRLFSKDSTGATVDGTGPSREGSAGPGKLTGSESTNSLQAKYIHAGGTIRIADQVIEEVDEQQTITSMAGKPPEPRPTAQSLFAAGPPPPSDPLPVPPGRMTSTNLSSSAPVGRTAVSPTAHSPTHSCATYTEVYSTNCAQGLNDNSSGLGSGSIVGAGDNISIGSSDTSEDEFTKLKKSRLRERMKYARSISAQQNIDDLDGENQMLLMDVGQSRMSLQAKSPRNSTYSDNPDT